ncbi:hypothetical protein BG005_008601 [Podila minutissima]|nr:hypothetical protein BG005_008601 [Podila minutissima]
MVAWRVYAYKTRRSVLPTYLQQNIFARTNSFISKPIPDEHTAPVASTVPHPSAPIRNETVIVIPAPVDTTETSEKPTMIAPVQNQLAKNMLTHIGVGLALGTAAAYGFWHKVVLTNREERSAFYVKYNANRA